MTFCPSYKEIKLFFHLPLRGFQSINPFYNSRNRSHVVACVNRARRRLPDNYRRRHNRRDTAQRRSPNNDAVPSFVFVGFSAVKFVHLFIFEDPVFFPSP